MTSTVPSDRLERLAPWVVGVLFALPVLIAKYPPMDDLPLHEASVGILRHWGDTRFAPPSVYMLNIGHANQLFSFLVLALAYVVPIAWASKLVVAGLLLTLPIAASHFAAHLGSSRWAALLVAPLGLGWLFFWGLVQNILGLVVLLWVLPTLDDLATRPTFRRALASAAAMILLFFAHEATLLAACLALVASSISAPSPLRVVPLAWRLLPLAVSAALIVAGRHYDWSVAGRRDFDAPPALYLPYRHKLESIPGVLFGGFDLYVRNLMMVLALVPVVLMYVERLRAPRAAQDASMPRWHAWRFELLTLLLFAAYMLLPATVKTTTLLYHRFLPPAWAILAITASAGVASTVRKMPRALCVALPIASLLIAWPSFADSHELYTELEPLIDHIEIGSTLAVLSVGTDEHRLWTPLDVSGHIIAVRGGKGLYDFTQSPVSPAVQRPNKRWVDPYQRMDGYPLSFRPAWDLRLFRYVLVLAPDQNMANVITVAFGDMAKLIAENGSWHLYESQLPLVPIDSDDVPAPRPGPPTLRHLFQKLAQGAPGVEPQHAN